MLDFIGRWSDNINEALKGISCYVLLVTTLFVFLFIYFYIKQAQKIKILNKMLDLTDELVRGLQPSKGMDCNLNMILRLIGQIIQAQVYAFYIYDPNYGKYVLKAVSHLSTTADDIRPFYSGLLPFKKKPYLPPLYLDEKSSDGKISIVKEENYRLINVPLGSGHILIVSDEFVPNRGKEALCSFTEKLHPIINILIEQSPAAHTSTS
jgi:hypothetical protein